MSVLSDKNPLARHHWTIEELETICQKFQKEGYTISLYSFSFNSSYTVSLAKQFDDFEMKTSGTGKTVTDALNDALAKFPLMPPKKDQ